MKEKNKLCGQSVLETDISYIKREIGNNKNEGNLYDIWNKHTF